MEGGARTHTRRMPAGLDGHPDPIASPARDALLDLVADRILQVGRDRIAIGIDGRSGAGKSTFADELATRLRQLGSTAIRSTTDLFHRPRGERLRRGPTSPEGYVLDSHQIDVIVADLLDPFRDGAAQVLVGAFDEPTDRPEPLTTTVPERAVLVFDGLFVRRPELQPAWDLSILLTADRRCDASWLRFLEHDLPVDPTARAAALDERLDRSRWPRYRAGWSHYLDHIAAAPADIVIDNDDLAEPRVVATPAPWRSSDA